MKKNMIAVKSEFAPLRKVVLAQSEFIFPEREDSNNDSTFLAEESLDLYASVDTAGKIIKTFFLSVRNNGKKNVRNLKKYLKFSQRYCEQKREQ